MKKSRIWLSVGIAFVVLIGAVAGTGWYLAHRLDEQVRTVDVFAGLDDRPEPASDAAAGAMNILLLGTDGRTDGEATTGSDATSTWTPGEQRADTMMLLHLSADRRSASVVSIPRDSWVRIPGHGKAKVNAAFSLGGPRLSVQTVEKLTGVRIDHVAWVDWAGFEEIGDLLGGVEVYIPETVYDSARKRTWTQGKHLLSGEEALLYVRQRYGLPGGDLDRVKRQQYVLRSILRGLRQSVDPKNPKKAYDLLDIITRHLTVDSGFSGSDLRTLALDLARMPSEDLTFFTAPVAGLGKEGKQSVVRLDKREGRHLWSAMREDDMETWLEQNQDALTGRTVN
ncbi:LCP family protein required for cell wall assembly [Nocardioides luteus]|uniref:Transcriptional regulator n=2 Tax=Nocardioides luteus TaxID=1844 RepID=A0ABQ5SVR9_9ACTN|nr:LCP family protein [Nocardioides luteus]MDR7311998.1 LCP family protein required for cell wall assembly [Nocardioides luteus]GGR68199.1 transcriptional regulator [Nocardioides luteus]GLJ68242.1 transcriptional regulator [Nocardioides luteus]